ncbi:hypothetical protein [Halorientalis regularis]|jgi:hypothetical protein|uniref:DUF7979 domain-containing protein n=1 Tax=Halorientalis regularis TaxID=660518 RepID=A0A1G7NX49_9EURY|nr:hypothetical protein [Halorientalis regularis]SDF78467.1 hypothetical protein SAMN05216218_109178 [Halorientalis regularis]
MEDHRVLGVGLLVIAVLLLANPLYLYPNPDEVNEVRVLDSFDGTPAANYTYENLSDRAQTVVDRARNAESGRITFRGNENRPREFTFVQTDQAVRVEGEIYRIEHGDEQFYVWTLGRPNFNTESNRSQGLLGLGFVLALMGTLYLWRPQPIDIGGAMAGAGTLLLLFNFDYRYTELLGGFSVLGSWVVILLTLLAAIVSLGYLFYRTMRERRLAGEF